MYIFSSALVVYLDNHGEVSRKGKAVEEIYLAGWRFWVFGIAGGIMAASIWKESGEGG